MSEAVRAQYEAYPYPARDPGEEARRLITGSPSRLVEIDHYLFAGRRGWSRPFRALVAGGGTGDGLVMLAQQLADAGTPAELVYLDLSAEAREIAEARIAARGLTSVRFLTGSLLDLPRLGLGRFDYIDCCGVLHHLPDPAAGLAALREALTDEGGIGVMVYGPYGRTGVYPLQAALRQLGEGLGLAERVKLARRLLATLPSTNWFRHNRFLADHKQGDAGLVDLLLHPIDRPYSVPALADLVAGAGLTIASFIEPLRYDPTLYLADRDLATLARALPPLERAALAERLAGNMKRHIVYLSRRADTVATLQGPEAVPVLVEYDGAVLARAVGKQRALVGGFDGVPIRLPLPDLAPAILLLIDGRRSLGEIHADLRRAKVGIDQAGFERAFTQLYAALAGINRLLLRYPT